MPLSSDDIVAAFEKAGITDVATLQPIVQNLSYQIQLQQIQNGLDSLGAKSQEILKPINDARIDLNNRKAELIALIGAAT